MSGRGAENTQNTTIQLFIYFVYLVLAFPIIETICCGRHQTAGYKEMEEGNWWKWGISHEMQFFHFPSRNRAK